MDFHSVMETFAEAWVAANTHTPLTEAAEQGLINGPTNHPTGNHPPPAHAPPHHAPPNHNSMILHPANHLSPVAPPPPPQPDPISDRTSSIAASSGPSPILAGREEGQPPSNVLEERREPEEAENGGLRSEGESPPVGEMKSPYKTLSDPHGKSLPVHCIVEQIPGPQACGRCVELDSYAIVPGDTLFGDLVRTALGRLGYSAAQILGAKGSIQVKKWKPLAFDQVTENPEATVADILGELTTVASLHVRLYSVPDNPQEWRDITVRNAVLELLREMSQSKLAKLCPLSQPMLSNIINNRYMGKIGKEKCQEFGQWYLTYRKQHPEGSTPEVVPTERPLDGRLTFHPTKELPMMRDWFHGCRNPSKRTLQMYVDILNQGPVRQQERPKVVLSTLKNWWKNEKQRERKNLRSDDNSQDKESGRAKRKKRSCSNPDNPTKDDISVHNFSGSSSQEPPKTTTNNFTMIHHDDPGKKECEGGGDNSFPPDSFPTDSKDKFSVFGNHRKVEFSDHFQDSKSKFTIFSQIHPDGSIERFLRKEEDAAIKEDHLFQKLHPDPGVGHAPSLFGFVPEHPVQNTVVKMCCDGCGTVTTTEDSRVSSEDDVDVGI